MIRPTIRWPAASGLLALVLGCTGSIADGPGGSKPAPSGPGSKPELPTESPMPPRPTGACKEGPPSPTRLWRLTHAQLRNTVFDTFAIRVPVLDTLPDESRLDGYANAS